MDAVAKWEKVLIAYRKKYIPITVGIALLAILFYGMLELGLYLENIYSLSSSQ